MRLLTVHFLREDNETRKKNGKKTRSNYQKNTKRKPSLRVLSDARRQEIRINALPEVKRNEIDKVFYKESITRLTFFFKRVSSAFTKTAKI